MTIGKLNVDPSAAVILNTIATIVLIAPVMWLALGYASRTDETQRKVLELQDAMKGQFSDLKTQIANLPTQAARLDQAEHAIADLRQASRDLAERIDKVGQLSMESRERLNHLDRRSIP